jgi:IBR domain, a half RING-finger domain/IBR domain
MAESSAEQAEQSEDVVDDQGWGFLGSGDAQTSDFEEDEDANDSWQGMLKTPEVYSERKDSDFMSESALKRSSLRTSGLHRTRTQKIASVAKTLCVELHAAQSLLDCCRWDEALVSDRFFDDFEQLCVDASLDANVLREHASKVQNDDDDEKTNSEDKSNDDVECSICFNDEGDMLPMPICQHRFCAGCWRESFEVSIRGGEVNELKCLQFDCKLSVPEHFVRDNVAEALFEKYSTFWASKMVEQSAELKWCPAAGCERAVSTVRVEGLTTVAHCACGFVFCVDCFGEAHAPAACAMITEWNAAVDSSTGEMESLAWILANTRKCPECGNAIAKADGCLHMTCKCGGEFCWICGSNWSSHGSSWYQCPNYTSAPVQNQVVYYNADEKKRVANEIEFASAIGRTSRMMAFHEHTSKSEQRAHLTLCTICGGGGGDKQSPPSAAASSAPKASASSSAAASSSEMPDANAEIEANAQALMEERHSLTLLANTDLDIVFDDWYHRCAGVLKQCRRVLRWTKLFMHASRDDESAKTLLALVTFQQADLEMTVDRLTAKIGNADKHGWTYEFKSEAIKLADMARGMAGRLLASSDQTSVELAAVTIEHRRPPRSLKIPDNQNRGRGGRRRRRRRNR